MEILPRYHIVMNIISQLVNNLIVTYGNFLKNLTYLALL